MAGMAGPEGNAQFKMFIVIMQSMTKKELDCRVVIDQPRALRLARGAGVHPQAVHVLTEQLKQMSQMMTGINKSGLMKGGDNSLSAKMRRNPKEIQQKLGKNIDPAMLSKLGGMDNFMKLLGACDAVTLSAPQLPRAVLHSVLSFLAPGRRNRVHCPRHHRLRHSTHCRRRRRWRHDVQGEESDEEHGHGLVWLLPPLLLSPSAALATCSPIPLAAPALHVSLSHAGSTALMRARIEISPCV